MTPSQLKLLRKVYGRCKPDGDCLIWQQAVNVDNGIPQMHIDNKTVNVRRLVFQLHVGRAPRRGYCIVSTCLNTACLEREHMAEYTRAQLVERNRKAGLFSSPAATIAKTLAARRLRAKLSIEIARELRRLAAEGKRNGEISRLTGVPKGQVSSIVRGDSWKELGANASIFRLAASGG